MLAIKKQVLEHADVEGLVELCSSTRFVDSGYRYQQDYLASTTAPDVLAITSYQVEKVDQWISKFMLHLSPGQTKRDALRINILRLLVKIKFLPVMRSIVKRIPQSLQRKIKAKLLK